MKDVLFVSYFFPPIQTVESTAALNAIKYLPKYGWRPIVVAAKEPKLFGEDRSLLNNVPGETEIFRVFSPGNFFFKALSHLELIPDPSCGWMPFALQRGREIIKKGNISAIISRANPITSHLVSMKLSREFNLPLVTMFGDPWIENPYSSYKNFFIKKFYKRIQDKIFRMSERIIMTTEETKNIYKDDEDVFNKIVALPNCYDPEEMSSVRRGGELEEDTSHKFTLLFAGSFYGLRTPEPFLKGLSSLIKRRPEIRRDISIKFIGSMGGFAGLISDYGLQDVVEIRKPIARGDILREISLSDALLLIDAELGGNSIFLPMKLVEYIASGKPILGLTPRGSAADIINKTKTGMSVSPGNYFEVEKAIEKFYDSYKEGRLAYLGNTEEIEKFSAESYAQRMSGILDGLPG